MKINEQLRRVQEEIEEVLLKRKKLIEVDLIELDKRYQSLIESKFELQSLVNVKEEISEFLSIMKKGSGTLINDLTLSYAPAANVDGNVNGKSSSSKRRSRGNEVHKLIEGILREASRPLSMKEIFSALELKHNISYKAPTALMNRIIETSAVVEKIGRGRYRYNEEKSESIKQNPTSQEHAIVSKIVTVLREAEGPLPSSQIFKTIQNQFGDLILNHTQTMNRAIQKNAEIVRVGKNLYTLQEKVNHED